MSVGLDGNFRDHSMFHNCLKGTSRPKKVILILLFYFINSMSVGLDGNFRKNSMFHNCLKGKYRPKNVILILLFYFINSDECWFKW